MIVEKLKPQKNGWVVIGLDVLAFLISIVLFVTGISKNQPQMILTIIGIIGIASCIFISKGLFTVEPNEAIVLLLFGKYVGTEKSTGFRWCNPFYTLKKISLRVRNFESEKLKVNDKKGNPIDISAIVVWEVEDTAAAEFEVEDFQSYVHFQTESAVRHVAKSYPYDDTEGESISLRSSTDEVSEHIKQEIQETVKSAGTKIIEARINHLAYSPEIAQAMLQRQQAEAIIDARGKIVDGAVGMVEMALLRLKNEGVIELDEERKANMVSNLMLVLCSDKDVQPIVNAGSLY